MLPRRTSLFKAWFNLPDIVYLEGEGDRFEIAGLEQWQHYWRDPYHLLLLLPWRLFVPLLVLGYGAVNTVFALAYLVQPGAIANAVPGSFWDAFFFSVQTLGSIGYGAMYPTTFYGNGVVAIEALFSLLSIAMITGLAFARFSRSDARVAFSKVAVIQPYNGLPTLIFRTANRRRNQILEANLKVYLLQDEVTLEGQRMRHFSRLSLTRDETPRFSLGWTVMHPIDEASPLRGATPDSLSQRRATLVVSLSGLDETIVQPLHARHTYGVGDLHWDHCFVDMIYDTQAGDRYIDYRYFDVIEPLPEPLSKPLSKPIEPRSGPV